MEDYTVDQEDGEEEEDVEVEDKSSQDMVENQDQEENKSVIIHLLGQLKLGMDLSKITLPTFILERRSLLEMFADCMAHPDFFLSLPDEKDPEKRLLLVLEWYLTSFHAGRRVDVAKKPYNPIIGETFRCSWLLTPETLSKDGGKLGRGASPPLHLNYIAEQVSHHPPVSAFYFECPEKKLCMNGSIWTKSRFLGMSVGVSLVGKVTLYMLSYGEQYEFGLPSCYARSILSVPWVEMGDKVTLACPQTSLTAYVNFQTKPFYGGKPNKVSAEVKNGKTGKTVCKVSGEWNGVLEFSYSDGSSKAVDTQKLKTWRKRVKPLNKQAEFESRRLWQHVTNALNVGDIKTATEHKRCLEDRQREGENFRKRTGTSFETKKCSVASLCANQKFN
ncbi:oxysterol-binding protein-related protein 11-like [Babylonia areolata]|uniref:oxysterol-binding protein-related protein 11-like n=1 Tax=Babylonia areolata TaxID=304850 RepID=UPI003FD2B5B2